MGRRQQSVVLLTEAERDQLPRLIAAGTAPARKLAHARVLLTADKGPGGPGGVDAAIAEAVDLSQPTLSRIRQQFVAAGWEAALNRRAPRRVYPRKLAGEPAARLLALTCSEPPAGQARGTLRRLAAKLVALDVVEAVSHQTVRRVLKKPNLSPG